jgi:hypothetical protein
MTEVRTSSRHERPCAVVEETRKTSADAGGSKQRRRKVHSLIDKVYDPTNLDEAWDHVRENKGSAGVDGLTIASFAEREMSYSQSCMCSCAIAPIDRGR